jgi:hypothetical protein
MLFAWMSLGWILLADIYVRLVSMSIIPDINTWGGIMWANDFAQLGVH